MTPQQCRTARAALGWRRVDLAVASKVSPDSIVRFEHGKPLRELHRDALRRALTEAGIDFIDGGARDTKVTA